MNVGAWLASGGQLAVLEVEDEGRPHDYQRYKKGCRCGECRRANARRTARQRRTRAQRAAQAQDH